MLTPATALTPANLKAAILPKPLTVAPQTPIRSVIAHMAQAGAPGSGSGPGLASVAPAPAPSSCALVMEADRLLGLVTHHDIVAWLAQNTDMEVPVSQVMETALITLSVNQLTSFREVDALFQHHPIRHLPILADDGRVIGLITRESLYQQLRFADVYRQPDPAALPEPAAAMAISPSEEFFRHTFDSAAVGIAHVLPQGDFIRVNQRFCDIVGYERTELLSCSFQQITHPDDLATDLQAFSELLAGQRGTYTIEKRYIRQGGSAMWASLTVSAVRDSQGTPLYCIGVVEDIDQRKKAERALEQQRDFSKLMVELASRFVDIGLDELPAAIGATLAKIGQATAVDSSYMFEFSAPLQAADPTTDTMTMTHEWCRRADMAQQHRVQQVPLAAFPWSMAQLSQRQAIYVPSVTDLPDAAAQDRMGWQRFHVASVLVVPLIQHANIVGMLGFASFDGTIHWDDNAIQLLQVMGQTIANTQERLEAEVKLQQSQQWFKRVLLDAPYPIIIHAEDGEILQLNQAWTELSGYTLAEIPTIADWTEKAYGQRQDDARTVIDQLYAADSKVNDGEYTLHTRAGSERVWDFSSAPLGPLPDGRRCVLSMAVDVTDRKLAEAERLKNHQTRRELKLLETILDVILAGYWDWHIPTQQNYLSPGLKRMFGYGADELPPAPNVWQTLIFPEDLPLALESFQRHAASGGQEPYSVEVRYRHKNGATVWVLCSGQIVEWDDAGNPLYVVGCHVDITQRKQAELELQKSDKHLKTAQRIGQIGSWEYDIGTGRVIWSDEVFRIFGRDPAAGAPTYPELLQMYLPEDRQRHAAIVDQALVDGQPYDVECRGRRADGTLFYMQARGEPLFDHQGTMIQLVGTILDITDRKLAEEKLLQTTAQLQASNQELEAFTYSVSHDLRSPLRAIDGFSQALLEDYGHLFDANGLDFFERIRSNVSRMGKLIDDLLRLSRVSRSAMQYGPVNLSQLVQNHVTELQESGPQRAVQFTIAPNVRVWADEALMQVVVNNLLNNAWKFTSHHPTAHIEFGSLTAQGQPVYFVRDDGAGFNMAYGDMLFGVFQRLHNADEFPGTGIGLATVQRVIHRHGGQVWAEAAVEQGATIFFTLPVASMVGGPA